MTLNWDNDKWIIVHGIWNRPLFLPPKRILLTWSWWGLEKSNHFAGRPHCTWFEYCWWNHLSNVLVEHNDPAWLIFRWGWMGQWIFGCWFIPFVELLYNLGPSTYSKAWTLKAWRNSDSSDQSTVEFSWFVGRCPKKNCCSRHNNVYNSTSAQELDQEGNDLWANFVEWCAFLGTSWHQRNLAWIWHPCPPGNGCYQKNGQDSEGKLRIKKDSFMCYKYIYNTWVTRTKRHMYSFLTITFSVALFVGWSSPLVTLTDEPWSPHFVG